LSAVSRGPRERIRDNKSETGKQAKWKKIKDGVKEKFKTRENKDIDFNEDGVGTFDDFGDEDELPTGKRGPWDAEDGEETDADFWEKHKGSLPPRKSGEASTGGEGEKPGPGGDG